MQQDLKLATRESILGKKDLPIERVEVPEWGEAVYVKGMTGAERDAFEASLYIGRGKTRQQNLENIRARLIARVVVDENGNRLFADEDAPRLGELSVRALDRIFDVAQRLNGMSAQDVEDLAGN